MKRALALAFLCAGCASDPIEDVDAAIVSDAFVALDAYALPNDAGDGLPQIDDLCAMVDGDAVLELVANETLACNVGTDATALLFPTPPVLPADYHVLHALCGRMDPTASTRDDLTDAALATDLRAWLADQLTHPALQRVFADGPADTDARVAALMAAWFPENAFEHVLCGELDPTGSGVWGLHLWSEWMLAEAEGRADYQCSLAAIDRHDVVTMRYRWQPEGRTAFANKPVGSFEVGMSPACMLALGYAAIREGVPTTDSGPSFHARIYGRDVSFTFASQDDAIVTMYAVE